MQRTCSSRLFCLVFIFIIKSVACLANDKLSGTVGVSPTGAATYSVAIEAPKGVGDLMPSIGIAYSSQSGNGLVGFGCNITGLSAITRGMKDWAHDNSATGISYGNDCALYLDGKRLLLKSGVEGVDGCIYAPEGAPLTKVTQHFSLTDTSCWFEVDTNDGMVYEYGHTAGKQMISNPSAVAAWYISKATNPLGQYINYAYQSENFFLYPSSITYGGSNSILFEYESRTDTVPFTVRNNGGYVAKRLKSVTTKAGGETYRTYSMTYAYDGNTESHFSRLQSIIEKGEDDNATHELISNWNNLPSFSESCLNTDIYFPPSSGTTNFEATYYISGDLNNDGISDYVRVANGYILNNGSRVPYVFIHTRRSNMTGGNVEYVNNPTIEFQDRYRFCDYSYQYGSIVIADLDGDGINDLVLPAYDDWGSSTSHYYLMRFSGKKIETGNCYPDPIGLNMLAETGMPLFSLADLNNNGKTDFIILEKEAYGGKYYLYWKEHNDSFLNIGLSLTSAPKRLYTSDFNHDGLTDIIVICSDGCRIFYNQGGTSLQNIFTDNSTLYTGLTSHDRMETGDFNGDGILDFIWNDNNSSYLYFELGNANGTFTRHLAYNLGFNTYDQNTTDGTWSCMVVDLDHDGKSDVVLNLAKYVFLSYNSSKSFWLLSNGTTLSKKKESSSTRQDDAKPAYWFSGDFRGQGFLEVANFGYDCYNGSNATTQTVNVYRNSSHNIANGKVASITDSNGRTTAFTYASMTSDQVYTRGTGSSYPIVDVAAPLCVVSQVNETGGSVISSHTNYTYAGLRAHLTGRGVLGFRSMTTSETNTGKVVTNTTGNDAPVFFVPRTNTTTTTQAGTTSTIVNYATLSTYDYGSQTNYSLFPTSQTATDIYGNITTTIRTYDTDKGLLQSEKVSDDGGALFKQVTYTYSTNKIAGAYRPTSTSLLQVHPDASLPFQKNTSFNYNNYGLRTSVVEFSNTQRPLTTSFQYDAHGNMTKETISGYGISSGTETNYQYSSDGKFLTQKSSVAGTVSYTHNAFGDLMAESDMTNPSNPLTTTYTRDGFGTLTKTEKPSGETTTWQREASNEHGGVYLIREKTLGSPEVKTWYDALDNEVYTQTTDIGEVEVSSTTTYNTRGEVTSKTTVHGSLTTSENFTYDGMGRMITSTASNGLSVNYAYGNRVVTTTQNGKTYTKTYNAWGDIVESDDPVSYVTYYYDATGKPNEIETENGTVSIEYDDYGNQIALSDPDAGLTTYQYDALHRITSQTDARGNVTTFTYDGAGRTTSKSVAGETITYTYGTSGNEAGRLTSIQTSGRSISYSYDDKGRLSQETYSMSGEPSLSFGYQYDVFGRLRQKTCPQGVNINYAYNGDYKVATALNGHNICFLNSNNGLTVKRTYGGLLKNTALAEPAEDGPANLHGGAYGMMGGGLPPTPEDSLYEDPGGFYNPEDPWHEAQELLEEYYVEDSLGTRISAYDSRGFLSSLSMTRGSSTVRQITFSFENGTGNLLARTGMTSCSEAFTYDGLDRLASINGTNLQNIYYDSDGNISEKTGPGFYTYGTTHPHAVTRVSNPQGSISSATQTATYTAFGKVQTLSDNGYTIDFTYGPDEERWKTVLTHNGSTVRTTFYADGYERVTENGQTRHIYYLDDDVIYILNDGASEGQFYYAFTDYLGSITRIYNESGSEVFSAEYDAWGQQTVTNNTLGFHRGYTGHEMMPEFGLINMNGRLYDPVLGRFLSPDNYVQMPDFSQSFNRYSYCLNNPLKYTDPDGEWFGIDDLIISGAAFVMGYVSNGISSGNWGWPSIQAGLMNAGSAWLGYNTAGLLGGSTPSTWSYISSMGINTIANSLFPPIYIPITDHFGLSVSPTFGFGGDGFTGGLNISTSYHNGDFTFSNTLGFTNNYYGAYSEIGIDGVRLGYGRTYYDSYDNVGSQTVGTFKLGIDKVSFALSNDLFAENHQDRWRTSAAELSIGNFSIGTYVITNDGQYESRAVDPNNPTTDRESPYIGLNKKKGAWKIGNAYMAPLWIGYKHGTNITRIGYSFKMVQALTQNLVHHTLVPTPDYTYYDEFYKGFTIYSGYYNPISLWNR